MRGEIIVFIWYNRERDLKVYSLTLRKGTMNFMKTFFTKPHLRISLQFFAENEISPVDSSIQNTGETSLSADAGQNESTSLSYATDAAALDSEFEQLIKGGIYENSFRKKTQEIIDKRFKAFKALEKSSKIQQPLLDLLGERYNVPPSDIDTLILKIKNDSSYVNAEKDISLSSDDSGTIRDDGNNNPSTEKTPDINTPKSKDTNLQNELTETGDKTTKSNQALALREKIISEKARLLSQRWANESREIKKLFPSFDLKSELANPTFKALLKSGSSMQQAYTATHAERLIQNAIDGTARRVAEQTLKSINLSNSRVAENGIRGGNGFTQTTDVASLTGKDIRSILKQVENGSKIRF